MIGFGARGIQICSAGNLPSFSHSCSTTADTITPNISYNFDCHNIPVAAFSFTRLLLVSSRRGFGPVPRRTTICGCCCSSPARVLFDEGIFTGLR